jgi:hypothetical protein
MPPAFTGSAKHPARPAPPAPLRYPADGSAAELERWQREGWYRPGTDATAANSSASSRCGRAPHHSDSALECSRMVSTPCASRDTSAVVNRSR